MFLIEPCCTQRHWPQLREKLGNGGTMFFHGYGDLSIAELLPVILTRYSETDMTIVCPALPDAAANVLQHWMDKKWGGSKNVLRHLTLITNLHNKKSPAASKWVKNNPWPDRLVPCNIQQNDTALLLPDIAIYGGLNMSHCGHFTALASTNAKVIENLRTTYRSLITNP